MGISKRCENLYDQTAPTDGKTVEFSTIFVSIAERNEDLYDKL